MTHLVSKRPTGDEEIYDRRLTCDPDFQAEFHIITGKFNALQQRLSHIKRVFGINSKFFHSDIRGGGK